MTDDYNLHRFLTAQAPIYDTVLAELRAGRKSRSLDLVYLSADRRAWSQWDGAAVCHWLTRRG